ncbi:ABC transporter permease [Sinosporangium siamense]|uniref:ABC transporter permease n=1 Tax=Sinosporangium siamense TaxID=1367973 RepID=A0A919V7P6_9ACTN|nr:ABC transporter permease [Sinosporangium siamense]GII95340.1 ABC transporter permease [Sinosporangium siamense]
MRRTRRALLRGGGATVAAAAVLGLVVAAAAAVPVLWPHDAMTTTFGSILEAPSLAHPMGTDGVGRDVLARFGEGARISLLIGLVAVVTGALAGLLIGLTSGLAGGAVDEVLMRVMDALMAFPTLMLTMAVTISLGSGLPSATAGVTIGTIPWFARVARSETLRITALPMVEAAVALGMGRARLIRAHVLPHMVSVLVVQATATYGSVILSVAALGFLGLGARVPTPEWGAMITEGMEPALTGAWWVAFFPGLGMLIVVTCTSVLSDRIRDVLDPRGSFSGVKGVT